MTYRSRGAALIALGCAAAASPAAAAPVGIQGIRAQLEMGARHGQVADVITEGCINIAYADWARIPTRDKYLVTFGDNSSAEGTYDGSAGRTDAHETRRTVFQLQRNYYRGRRDTLVKPLDVADFGIEVVGKRAYVTARLVVGKKAKLARAPRVRIAQIAHPKVLSGPATVPRHPSRHIPNSFLVAIQGRATVMPAFARAVNRLRCRSHPRPEVHPHDIKVGMPFGFVSVQLAPDGAAATAGTADLVGGATLLTDQGDELQAQPLSPTRSVTVDGDPALRFSVASGSRVPVVCSFGQNCRPAGGARFGMAGGFTVSAGGRVATVDALEVFYESVRPDEPGLPGLRGSIGGRPVTLVTATDAEVTSEALAALSDALGVTVTSGRFGHIEPTFTAAEAL